MKIVITGALGHIGSRLIRELPKAFPEAEIILLDNFLTQRYCSLFNLTPGNREFFEIDILKSDLEPFFDGADIVIHLAAVTDAAHSFENREIVELVNLGGSEKVALACSKVGASMIAISTTSVYGTQKGVVDESCPDVELSPQSPYAESKLGMEKMLLKLGKENGLSFVVCRFGTIFGTSPGMRFHTAVNKFIWQASVGIPITVWRTATNQFRPYLDLGDACRAVEFLIKKKMFHNEIFNVLTLNATVGDIIKAIQIYIPDVKIELVDECIMNQLSYEVSCEKFTNRGFKPTGSLNEAVKESIKLLDLNGIR